MVAILTNYYERGRKNELQYQMYILEMDKSGVQANSVFYLSDGCYH